MLGTNENWSKWSDIFVVVLPDIISGEIKFENILSMKVFQWLATLVGCEIRGIKELQACELNKTSFVGWWSL